MNLKVVVPVHTRKISRRIGINTLWLLFGRLGTYGLMVLFTLIIARRLSEVGLGAYAFMTSVIFLGNIMTTFGTDMLIIREVASKEDLSLVPASILMQLILAALFTFSILLIAPRIPNQSHEVVQALKIYSLALFPMAFYTVFSSVLRGYQRMNAFLWLNLAAASLQTSLAWIFVHPRASLVTLAWILLGTQVAVALMATWVCLYQIRALRYVWRIPCPSIRHLLHVAAPIALLALLKVVYQKLGIYMLSTLSGAAVTGWFSAALRLVEASQIGHIALLGALFPVMAQAGSGQRDKSPIPAIVLTATWRLLLILGIAAAGILFLLAPALVNHLFGSNFAPAIPSLRLLAGTMVPFSLNIYLASRLLAAGQERKVACTFALSLALLAVMNAWLIPRWDYMGASLATLIAEIVQSGIFLTLTNLD